jgi:hypothetical protein
VDTAGGGVDTSSCGDVDGPGGDTGDVPDVLGKWTTTFGMNLYDSGLCNVSGLELDDLHWLQGALEIDGRTPDMLYIDIDEDTRMWGLLNHLGGIVLTGTKVQQGHTLYISIGGHLYEQPQLDRMEIRGFGYIGVDLDSADTAIDCWLQGDLIMKKSGS